VQKLQHAVLAVALHVAFLDDMVEILSRPCADTVPLGIRPVTKGARGGEPPRGGQKEGPEGRQLTFGEPGWTARVRAIAQAFDAFFIEAVNRSMVSRPSIRSLKEAQPAGCEGALRLWRSIPASGPHPP